MIDMRQNEDIPAQSAKQAAPAVSIVTPCYNEQDVLPMFYREVTGVMQSPQVTENYELIFVDDGSSDHTLTVLNDLAEKDPCVRVYSLSRNFGHQIALTAGLDAARGNAIIFMDSDLQHPPALIPEMLGKFRDGYDVVSAIREDTEDVSWFKKKTSKLFYMFFNFLSETKIPEGAADFTLLSRKSYLALRSMPEYHRFLRGLISWIGFKRSLIPYTAPPRPAGESKYSVVKMYRLAIEGVMSFSAAPLKLATKIGFIIALLGFCYLAWILGRFFILKDLVTGWGSLISVTLILGGFQLFFIGLIGQYLAKVFEQSKDRPVYLFKQTPEDMD